VAQIAIYQDNGDPLDEGAVEQRMVEIALSDDTPIEATFRPSAV